MPAGTINGKSGRLPHVRMEENDPQLWVSETKQAMKTARLRCHRFRSNEVRLWLSVIAYNQGKSSGW